MAKMNLKQLVSKKTTIIGISVVALLAVGATGVVMANQSVEVTMIETTTDSTESSVDIASESTSTDETSESTVESTNMAQSDAEQQQLVETQTPVQTQEVVNNQVVTQPQVQQYAAPQQPVQQTQQQYVAPQQNTQTAQSYPTRDTSKDIQWGPAGSKQNSDKLAELDRQAKEYNKTQEATEASKKLFGIKN